MQVGRVNPPRRQVNRPDRTKPPRPDQGSHEVQLCARPFSQWILQAGSVESPRLGPGSDSSSLARAERLAGASARHQEWRALAAHYRNHAKRRVTRARSRAAHTTRKDQSFHIERLARKPRGKWDSAGLASALTTGDNAEHDLRI